MKSHLLKMVSRQTPHAPCDCPEPLLPALAAPTFHDHWVIGQEFGGGCPCPIQREHISL